MSVRHVIPDPTPDVPAPENSAPPVSLGRLDGSGCRPEGRLQPCTPDILARARRQLGRLLTGLACATAIAASTGAADPPGPTRQSGMPQSPPPLAPLPAQVPEPESNLSTPARIELGRRLFFDPRLSGNNTQSCASCHDPRQGWTEAVAKPRGATGTRLARNTPTILNVGFLPRLFWDGRAESLEIQALAPITAADELDQDLGELERELSQIADYRERFRAAYGVPPRREAIAKALAAFQRSLVTGPSPFDRYLAGESSALSEGARRGYALFTGEAGCVRCHSGPLLSDGKEHRLGVSFRDPGLAQVTGRKEDRARFRTPSLRNVAKTAPYMHDGSLSTLTDVVTFYYRGIPPVTPDGLPLDIRPRTSQSFSEIADLVEFLESLTGEAPVVSPVEPPQ